MLRTIISLCALLAALFFVFRGIQESSAKGESPSNAVGKHSRPYQQLILQRARQLRDSATSTAESPSADAEVFELAIEEVDLGQRILELLEAEDELVRRLKKQPLEPAYTQQAIEQEAVEQMLADPFASIVPEQHEAGDETVQEQAEASGTSELRLADSAADKGNEADFNPLRIQPQPQARELTQSEQVLSNKIRYCLNIYRNQMELSSRDKNCWECMHTLIGYGVDNHVWVGRHRFNTVGYLCWNGKCKGFDLFENHQGQLRAKQGYGVQGHHGQFLAMLAQHRVDPDYMIKAGGKNFTIHDLIEFEKKTCVPKSELTFKLIALTHYLDSDATWSNEHGAWSIPRLIREEMAQPVVGSACGGTHRLMGLSYAARYREVSGEPMTGEWQRAKEYTDDFHDYAFHLQNRNGSFSTNWFEGRADDRDPQRYQETSGHIVEWLAFSLPQQRLHDQRMVAAVDFLANLLLEHRDQEWKIGPRGHAIRALALYHERAYGQKVTPQLAQAAQPVGWK
jgi:hypothetical protein